MVNLKILFIIFIVILVCNIFNQMYFEKFENTEHFEETINPSMENDIAIGFQIGTNKFGSYPLNKWILNTPNNGEQVLKIAPRTDNDSGWNWENQTSIDNKGNLIAKSIIGKSIEPIILGTEKNDKHALNKWIFQTPNDGNQTLNIAPRKQDNLNWDWEKQIKFDNNGNLTTSGNLITTSNIIEIGNTKNNILNKWNIYTPDDGSELLYIGPKKSDDSKIDINKSLIIDKDGNVTIPGNLNIIGNVNVTKNILTDNDINTKGNINVNGKITTDTITIGSINEPKNSFSLYQIDAYNSKKEKIDNIKDLFITSGPKVETTVNTLGYRFANTERFPKDSSIRQVNALNI